MNKKVTALLIVAALMVAVAGCDSLPGMGSSSSAPATSSTPASSAPPTSQSQELVSPVREFTRGTTTETDYTSEYWGLKFTVPSENVALAPPEQMNDMINTGGTKLGITGEAAESINAVSSELLEMSAVDMTVGSSLVIISQELPMAGFTEAIVIEGALEGIMTSAPNGEVIMESDGIPVEEIIAGRKFSKVTCTIKNEGVPDIVQSLYVHVEGKRMLTLTAGYAPSIEGGQESMDSMLAALTILA